MNYKELAEQEIALRKIIIVKNSTCWERTHAHIDGSKKICKWKNKNSYPAFFDLLHEIGHIETHRDEMKRCEQESEATIWAIKRMRELGLHIKRKYTNSYKKYIKKTYERGMRRGLQKKVKSKLYM